MAFLSKTFKLIRSFTLTGRRIRELESLTRLKRPVNINEIFDVTPKSLSSLNESELVKYFFVFSQNFQSTENFESLSKTVQQELLNKFSSVSSKASISFIKGINNSIKKFDYINTDLLKKCIDYSHTTDPLTTRIARYKEIAYLTTWLTKYNIEYEMFFKEALQSISNNDIENFSQKDLENYLELIVRLNLKKSNIDLYTKDGTDVFQFIGQLVDKRLENNSLDIKTIFILLRCLVISDRGAEDTFRKLETLLFTNLQDLDAQCFIKIPQFYHKRILHDYRYVIETGFKPFYEEFANRYPILTIDQKHATLHEYWHNSNYYGMYCDELLADLIYKDLKNPNFFKDNAKNINSRDKFLVHSFSYLNHSRQLDQEILDKIFNWSKEFYSTMLLETKIMMAINFAKNPGSNREFWNLFVKDIDSIAKNQYYDTFLYAAFLSLRLQSPEDYEIIREKAEKYHERMRAKWVAQRKKDILSSLGTQMHNEIEKKLQEKEIEYIKEYYLEYFVDIALPKQKVCIEVIGPGHFLHPSKIFNGRTFNKQKNIEKQGWKYHTLPFYKQRSNTILINKFLSAIIPV